MEILVNIVVQVLQPLSLGIVATAIIAGLFFGSFYNHNLNIPDSVVFHKLVTGIGFIFAIFVYRLATALVGGAAAPTIFGWVGIAILWAIFCGAIYIGRRAIRAIHKRAVRKL